VLLIPCPAPLQGSEGAGNAAHERRRRTRALLCLLITSLLLTSCSALKFTYNRAPTLSYWWLDSYLDLDAAQTRQAKAALREWFGWHRATVLADYDALLATLAHDLRSDTTPAAICAWYEQIQQRLDLAYAAAVPPLAALAVTLQPAQIAHLARQFDKHNDELAEEYLEGTVAARRTRLGESLEETLESVYGRLNRSQRAALAAQIARAPFDAARWLAERRARQAEILDGLRELQGLPAAGEARRAHAERWLRTLGAHFFDSPRAAYRAHKRRVVAANCALVATLHGTTTSEQRTRAIRKVGTWRRAIEELLAEQISPP